MRILVLFLTFMCFTANVPADSFRCGRKIVVTGDTVNTLIEKCGNPKRKFGSKETISDGGRQAKVAVSNWVFERGRKNDIIVSVRRGEVVKIQVQ